MSKFYRSIYVADLYSSLEDSDVSSGILWRECLAAVIGHIRVALIFSKLNYSLLPSLKIKRRSTSTTGPADHREELDIDLSLSLGNNLTITRQCYS